MRTETKTVYTLIMAIGILLTLMLPQGYATVYQASDSDDWAYPPCSASFAIDDVAHTFSVTWSSAGYILFPVPAVFSWCTWKIWDNLGYSHADSAAPVSGTVTFDDYYNTETWAHGEVKWTFVFPVPEGIGMYIATAGVTFYVGEYAGGGGGGCPYVSTWDGSKYLLDNNVLPRAEFSRGADVEDYYKLERMLVPKNGKFSLLLSEFEKEHSYIDQVKLIAVDHESDVNIAVTSHGEILTYRNPTAPISAVENYGNNRLSEISFIDGNISDPSTYFYGFPGDYLILNFGQINSENAKLIIRDDMKKMDECILVQVKDGNSNWQTVEVLTPRAYWSIEAVNLAAYVVKGQDFMVRLYWKNPHRIDYVGLDTTKQDDYQIRYANIVSATHSTDGDVRALLIESDNRYTELVPDQQIQLTFTLPQNTKQARTYILYTKGHYTNLEG